MKPQYYFLLLLVLLSSCSTFHVVGGSSSVPISFAGPDQDNMRYVTHIVVERNISLRRSKKYHLPDLMRQELDAYRPDGVYNVTFKTEVTMTNLLINMVTFGYAHSRTIIIEADFYRY